MIERVPLRPRGVLLVVAVWTAWGLWSLHQRSIAALLTGTAAPPRANPWPVAMASAWMWAVGTLVVIGVSRTIHGRIGSRGGRLAAHAAAFTALHVIDVTIYWAIAPLMGGEARPWLALLFALATFNLLVYAVVAFGITAFDAAAALRARATREAQLEAQLSQAQLHFLRAQLQPHFLFNALNGISSLIHTDPEQADRMLARISELLRAAIDAAPVSEVPLGEELAFAARYLEIEQMRYGDRLDVAIDVPAGVSDLLVPSMLLQPLIENAVRHGVAPRAEAGAVQLRVRRAADDLVIAVRDSGAGFDPDTPGGAGLRITRERLASLYGAGERLSFAGDGSGFEARVTLPCRRSSNGGPP
jgi:hypothetical protein